MKFIKSTLFLFLSLAINSIAHARAFSGKPESLSFTENVGQVTDQNYHARTDIQFRLAATGGLNVYIGSGAIHYQFSRPLDSIALINGRPAPGQYPRSAMYRMDVVLAGANTNAVAVKEQLQANGESYYTPGTGEKGAIAQSCNKITYKEVYPHIDWVLYVKDGNLKHEFVVKKGGNVNDIQLQYSGSTALTLNNDGSLSATTPQGIITEQAPYTYQADGRAVSSRYHLAGNTLSFETGNYSGDLTIDPSLGWATYYGGSSSDFVSALATERNGNIYMAGYTQSTNNIVTSGAFQDTLGGGTDIFLVKFDPAGNRLWGTYFGGSQEDVSYGLATDTFGHVYLCGYTSSMTGIATSGTQQSTYSGVLSDAFLAQFDTAGHRQWATYLGGGAYGYDIGYAVAVDNTGNVYMTGVTSNSTLIASGGAFQPANMGGPYNGDAFLIKYDTTGNRVWGTYYGGSNDDFGYTVCVDKYRDVYIAGSTASGGGLSTPGAFQLYSGGGTNDAFIAKFHSDGSRIWATYYGGTDQDGFEGCATDTAANLYLCGRSGGHGDIATPGAYQTVFGGLADVMLVKFNNTGTRQWGTYYGGSSSEYANGIGITDSGNLFIAGSVNSHNAIVTSDAYQYTYGGNTDAFIAKFSDSGTLMYGSYYGASGTDACSAIALSGTNIYIGGLTENTFGIATPGSFQPTFGGLGYDGYLAKFEDCPALFLTSTLTPPAICNSTLFTYTPTGNMAVASLSWMRDTLAGIANAATSGIGSISETLVNTTNTPIDVIYVYTISYGTCSDTQGVHITVYPSPQLNSSTTLSTCTGVPFVYTPTSGTAGSSFTWTRATVAGISPGASAGTGSINEVLINSGSTPVSTAYIYTITANGCTDTQQLIVTVLPATVAATITGPDSVCVAESITLTASVTGGTWSNTTGNASVAAGVVTGITGGSDVINYAVTGACGPATATHAVTVKSAAACNNAVGSVQASSLQLTAYPNPNDGTFSLLFSSPARQEVRVSVSDIMGRKVYESVTESNRETPIQLDAAHGVYILSATTSGATYTMKVTVQ